MFYIVSRIANWGGQIYKCISAPKDGETNLRIHKCLSLMLFRWVMKFRSSSVRTLVLHYAKTLGKSVSYSPPFHVIIVLPEIKGDNVLLWHFNFFFLSSHVS